MRVLVTGSRDWEDHQAIRAALLEASHGANLINLTLVQGGCTHGADWLAYRQAHRWGWKVEVHPANWSRYGKAAGPIRNEAMVRMGADACLAFIRNNSRGATHCADLAEKAGIPVKRFTA